MTTHTRRQERAPEGTRPARWSHQLDRVRPRRTGPLFVAALLFALVHTFVSGVTPIANGPRDPMPQTTLPDRFTPPLPVTDERFATFPYVGPHGQPGLWVLPSSSVPLEFVVEQEVLDRFGEPEVREAVEVWNDVPGSRFGASIVDVVASGVDERRRDGVNRIFVDRRSCGGRYLARAHLWPGEVVVRDGRATRYITEVDLGVCDRLRPDQLAGVIRHELGHIAGLDHLCDAGEDCHRPGMAEDNTCRVMSPRAHPCQTPAPGDHDGLVHLHPRLPRVAGGDVRTTSASVSMATHPTRRASLRAVVTPYDADRDLQVTAAALAGHLGAPHLFVRDDCTEGPAGVALDRVLSLAGQVIAVGPVGAACLATLRGAWALQVEELPDRRAVVDRMIRHLGRPDRPPARLLVATSEAGGVPGVGAVAASVAVASRAPLVLLDDAGDPSPLLDLVDGEDRVTEVTLVGDDSLLPLTTQFALANAGLHVRRVEAPDATEAAVALSALPHLWGDGPVGAAIASSDHPDHVVGAIALAVAQDGVVLPVGSRLSATVGALLRDRVDRGAVVGGVHAIDVDRQIALSRLVDAG
jgi:hypothetical protein